MDTADKNVNTQYTSLFHKQQNVTKEDKLNIVTLLNTWNKQSSHASGT